MSFIDGLFLPETQTLNRSTTRALLSQVAERCEVLGAVDSLTAFSPQVEVAFPGNTLSFPLTRTVFSDIVQLEEASPCALVEAWAESLARELDRLVVFGDTQKGSPFDGLLKLETRHESVAVPRPCFEPTTLLRSLPFGAAWAFGLSQHFPGPSRRAHGQGVFRAGRCTVVPHGTVLLWQAPCILGMEGRVEARIEKVGELGGRTAVTATLALAVGLGLAPRPGGGRNEVNVVTLRRTL